MASITTEARNELIALYTAMFNAAPGAANLNDMVAAVESGKKLIDVANTLAAKPDFGTVYPGLLTADEFAGRLVASLLGSEASQLTKDWATGWVKSQLNSGVKPAGIITTAVQALRATTSADFLNAKAMLANKVDVASYYSVTKLQSSTDLSALQGVISGVTSTAASVTSAKTTVDGIASAASGKAYSLTTSVDTLTGGAGDDTFSASIDAGVVGVTAATSTLTALDTIIGGDGRDSLKISAITDFAVPGGVTVSGVESITIAAAEDVGNSGKIGTAGVDLSVAFAGATSLTIGGGIEVDIKAPSTAAVTVTGASSNVEVIGGTSQTVSLAAQGGALNLSKASAAIVVTSPAQGANGIVVDGGTTVDITATSSNVGGTTGAITVGGTSKPTGNINVTSTISEAKGTANTSGGTITVSGGKEVVVSQTATKALQTTNLANGTITNGSVFVTGDTGTTSVTVKNSAAVTAVDTLVAVTAVTEVNTVTFTDLTAGQTIILNGLTFTSAGATTAAQAAAAFANLTSGDAQGSSTKGTYSGTFTAGWTSGAASADNKVVFTGTTAAAKTDLANTGSGAATVVVTTDGVTAVTAAGKVGVTANVVGITDVNYASATLAGTIKTATVENYTSFGFNGNSLSTLSLKGGSGNMIIDNSGLATPTNTTLNLTVDGITGGTLDDADVYTTLNVTTKYTGTSTTTTLSTLANVTFGGMKALNVSGDKVLALTSTTGATALVDVAVTGTAGLTATFGAATMKTINTSGTTGTATITFDATKATYTGGAGKDVVTTSAVAPDKAISLAGGDDTLALATGTTAVTGAITGGDGVDTLSMVVADAAVADDSLVFASLVTGFEQLTLTGSTGAQAVLLSNLGLTNKITVATGSGTTTLTDFANAGTLTLTGDRSGDGVTISNAAFATPATDSVNVVMTATAGFDGGTVTAANVETVSLTATDTDTKAITSHTLIVTADKATTLNVAGNAGVSLTLAGSTLLATLDATASTGVVTATSVSAAALTMKGGSAADILTASTGTNADVLIGNDGADTLTSNAGLTTLTGGAGLDVFVVATPTSNIGIYTTITDFAAGDLLKLDNQGTEIFNTTKVALADTADFESFLNKASEGDGSTNGIISWFQFGANTYVVEDQNAGAAFNSATDIVVKLTGLIDLSVASINTGSGPTISL